MSRSLRTILALVAVCAVGRPAAASLRDNLARASETVGINSGSAFDALAEAIAITNANNIPVVSASAGFTYRYNPQLEAFERSAETLGPIFLERPRNAGAGQVQREPELAVRAVQRVRRRRAWATCRATAPSCCATSTRPATCSASRPTGSSTASGCRTTSSPSASPTASSTTSTSTCSCRSSPRRSTSASRAQQVQTAGPDGTFAPDTGPPVTGRTDGNAFGAGDLLLRLKYQLPPLATGSAPPRACRCASRPAAQATSRARATSG